MAGTFTPGTATGHTITGSTVVFNGAGAQTIPAFNFNNLTSSNTGARTLAASGTIGIAGTFTPGANAYTLTGSTIAYNGTSAQTPPAGFPTYNNLTINNAAGVSLGANTTASGLSLSAGSLTTGPSLTMIIASGGSVNLDPKEPTRHYFRAGLAKGPQLVTVLRVGAGLLPARQTIRITIE